jgi:hypothetical protein
MAFERQDRDQFLLDESLHGCFGAKSRSDHIRQEKVQELKCKAFIDWQYVMIHVSSYCINRIYHRSRKKSRNYVFVYAERWTQNKISQSTIYPIYNFAFPPLRTTVHSIRPLGLD